MPGLAALCIALETFMQLATTAASNRTSMQRFRVCIAPHKCPISTVFAR